MRAIGRRVLGLAACALLGACSRAPAPDAAVGPPTREVPAPSGRAAPGDGSVTISGDDGGDAGLNWRAPLPSLTAPELPAARRDAARALEEGRLYRQPADAIPLYLAIRALDPDDAVAARGLERARVALLRQGQAMLERVERDEGPESESGPVSEPESESESESEPSMPPQPSPAEALRSASEIAAVLRALAPADGEALEAYLARLDRAERVFALNEAGQAHLRADELGEAGGGALARFREALALMPGQPRALRGVAEVEAALLRRAESAAEAGDFQAAEHWLLQAARVAGSDDAASPLALARERVEALRRTRLSSLRSAGIADLSTPQGLRAAREKLAEMLRIAAPGDAIAADFRQRVDLATHYGVFRPGQVFTDALVDGSRGPQMVVVPHGGFRMGAPESEADSQDSERPVHYVRFDRGFAVSRTEVTVGEFRRFIEATGHRARASRRGHSIVYDERSGNFVRRNGVDWQSDYAGAPAADDLPVLHISVYDAEAYAAWLSERTGRGYRLPSEAEFEYVLRAGGQGRYPWGGDRPPPENVANMTGSLDVSPGGRHWNNAFPGYGDGHWGPAPVGRFAPNAWGVHDMAGNVSEWVADCWHASYRRAPAEGAAWFNPGCRSRVVRGASWASAPHQARAAWRYATNSDLTNARVGFRLVRGI